MQLELKLGLGGTSYEDFIRTLHLPLQLRCFEEPVSYSELAVLTEVVDKFLLAAVQSGRSHSCIIFRWSSWCYLSFNVG